MKVNMTESQFFKEGQTKEMQTFQLSKMISQECYKRIFDDEIVSNEILAVVGCMKDKILIDTFGIALHKHQIGFIVVIADAFSLLFVYFIFWRLKPLIDEYLSIVDNNMIKYSDFSFQIKDMKLDAALQDYRMIKMKIWVHLNTLLQKSNIKNEQGERL